MVNDTRTIIPEHEEGERYQQCGCEYSIGTMPQGVTPTVVGHSDPDNRNDAIEGYPSN